MTVEQVRVDENRPWYLALPAYWRS